jgi:hypothetical protein
MAYLATLLRSTVPVESSHAIKYALLFIVIPIIFIACFVALPLGPGGMQTWEGYFFLHHLIYIIITSININLFVPMVVHVGWRRFLGLVGITLAIEMVFVYVNHYHCMLTELDAFVVGSTVATLPLGVIFFIAGTKARAFNAAHSICDPTDAVVLESSIVSVSLLGLDPSHEAHDRYNLLLQEGVDCKSVPMTTFHTNDVSSCSLEGKKMPEKGHASFRKEFPNDYVLGLLSVIVVLIAFAQYQYCLFFTRVFIAHTDWQVWLSAVFSYPLAILGALGVEASSIIDQRSGSQRSLQLIMLMLPLMFYSVFLKGLYTMVPSVKVAVFLQIVSLVKDLTYYPGRMTRPYLRFRSWLYMRFFGKRVSPEYFITVLTMSHWMSSICSRVAIANVLITTTILQYLNQGVYGHPLPHDEFITFVVYCCVIFASDWAIHSATATYIARVHKRSTLVTAVTAIKASGGGWWCILFMAHILSDVVTAKNMRIFKGACFLEQK